MKFHVVEIVESTAKICIREQAFSFDFSLFTNVSPNIFFQGKDQRRTSLSFKDYPLISAYSDRFDITDEYLESPALSDSLFALHYRPLAPITSTHTRNRAVVDLITTYNDFTASIDLEKHSRNIYIFCT